MTQELLRAIEQGELTKTQLRELIAHEAQEIGLTTDQAFEHARTGTLPPSAVGSDLRLLIGLLRPV